MILIVPIKLSRIATYQQTLMRIKTRNAAFSSLHFFVGGGGSGGLVEYFIRHYSEVEFPNFFLEAILLLAFLNARVEDLFHFDWIKIRQITNTNPVTDSDPIF